MISDVRIYNLQLSQSQVETIYTTEGRDGIAEGLINRWTIDEGAPDTVIGGAGTVKDSAGSLHMGAVNSPTYTESRLGIVKRF
jgi:hypothetical protein